MFPMKLQVLHLGALGNSRTYAVVAYRKYRHAELEHGLKALSPLDAYGGRNVSETGIVTEQRLPEPILYDEANYRGRNVQVGLTTDTERDVFTADTPGKPLAFRIAKIHVEDRGSPGAEAWAHRFETEYFDIVSEL